MNSPLLVLALGALGYYWFTKDDTAAPASAAQTLPYAAPAGAPLQAPITYAPAVTPPAARPAPRPAPAPMGVSDDLLRLATNLYVIAGAAGVSCAAVAGPTAAFQQQAAADGHSIAVDGKYGPAAAALLDRVLSQQGLRAPADLWGAGRRCRTAPGAGPLAATTPGGGVTHAEQFLLDPMGSAMYAGDVYLANGDTNGAVEAFKAAGRAGVSSVGPAIDGQTRGASVSATRQAWLRNGELGKIGSQQFSGRPSTSADAVRARDLAHQMFNLYASALGVPSPVQRASVGYAYA